MKKVLIGFVAILFIAGMVGVTLVYAGAFQAPTKTFVFQNKKAPVKFVHKPHLDAGLKCEQCHHMWKDKTKAPRGCKECHKAQKTNGVPRLYDMAHKSDHSCKGCHKARAKAGKSHGPTKCSGCHKK